MAEPRDRYHHGNLRRELVERATESIRAVGENKFSLRAIARAAGVDVAATYRHFRNKDALLQAVAVNAFADLARRMMDEQALAATPVERFHALGRAYIRFATDEPALFRMAFGPQGSGGLSLEQCATLVEGPTPHQLFLDCLAALSQAGLLQSTVEDAILPAWAAVHGLAHLAVGGNLSADGAVEATRSVVGTVLRGLLDPAAH